MPLSIYSKERDERRAIIILYFGALVIMSIVLYATYMSMRQFKGSSDEVRRYNSALVELGGVLRGIQEQESAVRGFLLTGDTLFLGTMTVAKEHTARSAARLGSLLPGPAWHAQLNGSRYMEARVQARLLDLLNAHDEGRLDQGTMATELVRQQAAMASLREMHTRMANTIRTQCEPLIERQRIDGFSTPIMLMLYSALAITATALLFWRVSHALHSAEKAKLDLRLKLAELDVEVMNRTSVQMLLQRVLDTSPNGIMTFQAVRDEGGRIVDFLCLSSNRQASVMVGHEDLVGKMLLQEMPEYRAAGLFDAYVAVVGTGVPFRKELSMGGNGSPAWLSVHAVRLEDGFMVTLSDITEQRRALEVNAEADRIALTGQITRTVAHEVRNPLTNIHLAVEQLQDEMQDKAGQVVPFFQIIERNLKRIGALINGMLESSKHRELALAPCQVTDILGRAMQQVADRLALKEIKGEVDVANGLPAVLVDRELIDLAISNLAINAVEAMEPGAGRLVLKACRSGMEVLIEISDNGKGIPAENVGRLFEPFYSSRPGGLGLGLTTTRSILNSHKVKLEVRSILGVGTTFTLRFPGSMLVDPVPHANALASD